jgi:peptidoglycan/xylan/chitin deacetylase (PgdA/CDA1 family)
LARVAGLLAVGVLAAAAPPAASNGLSLGPGGELERLPTHQKVVALTFDGGSDAGGAAAIVRTLERKHATATFFLTGMWARRYPKLARRIGARFPVGDHTYDHADLTRMSSADVRRDILRGTYWLRAIARRNPRPLFRFPYGARDSRTLAIVRRLGYVSVRWSLDTWGWMGTTEGQSVASVVARVASRLRRGDVILLHLGAGRDGSMLDARALPRVIDLIRHRGYRFVGLGRYLR